MNGSQPVSDMDSRADIATGTGTGKRAVHRVSPVLMRSQGVMRLPKKCRMSLIMSEQ